METAFATLKTDFLQNSSAQAAEKMSAYMLNQFPFIGLTAPFRRQLASTFIKSSITEPLEKIFTVVDALWDLPQREFQYIAIDLMQKNIKRLNLAHLPFLLDLALKKSWWDSVDGLASISNKIFRQSQKPDYLHLVEKAILDENLWIRRIALLHQLGWKDKTDTDLLYSFALQNAADTNFFIQKAIGWSLRDYAKYNPTGVYRFIDQNKGMLSKLTYREAGKHRTE
ncbi:DNA alkylation repair enzyme [Legionella birminghamensis]|uniref:DNA alkylation repair enzyme n=1 Tax=Legionella birminghamensis TaxID=28083 RepID=A0A378I9G8_9GAMM|nr:DNA alkylation repair protein [Legionella birminghamensis]KTC75191.1 DNA alkylation repair enzyme [Legionella birminghamensis]STX31858.1 DNA alkylation repair enzyme [Legionella birminghamensis]